MSQVTLVLSIFRKGFAIELNSLMNDANVHFRTPLYLLMIHHKET